MHQKPKTKIIGQSTYDSIGSSLPPCRFKLGISSMKPKQSSNPVTRVKKPEPSKDSPDWIIWAAWADRITFEEIYKVTGLTESKVIAHMRKSLKPSSFRLWRKRASTQSIKHQKLFRHRRSQALEE